MNGVIPNKLAMNAIFVVEMSDDFELSSSKFVLHIVLHVGPFVIKKLCVTLRAFVLC